MIVVKEFSRSRDQRLPGSFLRKKTLGTRLYAVFSLSSCFLLPAYAIRLHCTAFRNDAKKHPSVPFRNAIFRGIIATETCCFAQLLKVVHSVSDRCLKFRTAGY